MAIKRNVVGAVITAAISAALVAGLIWSTNSGAPQASAAGPQTLASCTSTQYYALNPANTTVANPAKEVPGADGPAVLKADGTVFTTADVSNFTADEQTTIKVELATRRTCDKEGDFLLAQHYAAWSNATDKATGKALNLTSQKVSYSDVDVFAAHLEADPAFFKSSLTEIEALESASTMSLKAVPAGLFSLYVKADGHGGVNTFQGTTSHKGIAVVYTSPSGAVVEYRLNCGFQFLQETPFPGLPKCSESGCVHQCPPGQGGVYPTCWIPCSANSSIPQSSPDCGKNWALNHPPVHGANPQLNDPYETTPTAPATPAPVQPAAATPPSTQTAPGATPPATDRSTPAPPATGTTPDGGSGNVNGSTGNNNGTVTP